MSFSLGSVSSSLCPLGRIQTIFLWTISNNLHLVWDLHGAWPLSVACMHLLGCTEVQGGGGASQEVDSWLQGPTCPCIWGDVSPFSPCYKAPLWRFPFKKVFLTILNKCQNNFLFNRSKTDPKKVSKTGILLSPEGLGGCFLMTKHA